MNINKNELNIDNLRTFVEALNALPTEIKNKAVDMQCMEEPVFGGVSSHEGLISIVADYVPELKSLYGKYSKYEYSEWADTIAEFLGFVDQCNLRKWAKNNPEVWGSEDGFYMFDNGETFGQETDKFKHSVIIKHWTKVLERVEESNK